MKVKPLNIVDAPAVNNGEQMYDVFETDDVVTTFAPSKRNAFVMRCPIETIIRFVMGPRGDRKAVTARIKYETEIQGGVCLLQRNDGTGAFYIIQRCFNDLGTHRT